MRMRALVLSEDPVDSAMGGNAIRAYELAKALARHADVTLAAPGVGDDAPGVERAAFDRDDPRALRSLLRGVDVVLALPQNPVVAAQLRRSGARVVYDMYDPKPLQMLEAFAGEASLVQRYWSTIALDHVLDALAGGSYLICASERQRDLWIGAMLASRLITPALYRSDPTLRSVIDVVPFGVPAESPVASGGGPYERFSDLDRAAEIVLWNGGLWNWLDPVTAIEAIARVVEHRPRARLVFMGRAPLDGRQALAATAARTRAAKLGLLDSVVFFNDAWVPYGERADWLLAASCAVSLHVEHLETRFSFRTRLLDCFWAGLPVVCTAGDELAERVARDRLGGTVAAGDSGATAEAIVAVLERDRGAYREALARIAAEHLWVNAARPLVEYVKSGSGDSVRGRAPWRPPPARRTRAVATRAVRGLQRSLRRAS